MVARCKFSIWMVSKCYKYHAVSIRQPERLEQGTGSIDIGDSHEAIDFLFWRSKHDTLAELA